MTDLIKLTDDQVLAAFGPEDDVDCIKGNAKAALMEHTEIDEATARRVVIAISKGLVPCVSINF